MEINSLRIYALNRNYGFGGIVLYLMSRLYTIKKEKIDNPFDEMYLRNIYERIKIVIDQRDITCDCIDILLGFMKYYEKKHDIVQPSII
jgi:hypothetical protein